MSPPPDHYRTLGIRRDADAAQIRAAYVRLVKAHHPDSRARPQFPEHVRLLQQAYSCLRDPDRRAAHDTELLARDQEHLRQLRRVRRKLRYFDRRSRTDLVAVRRQTPSHLRPAVVVAAGGAALLTLAAFLLG